VRDRYVGVIMALVAIFAARVPFFTEQATASLTSAHECKPKPAKHHCQSVTVRDETKQL